MGADELGRFPGEPAVVAAQQHRLLDVDRLVGGEAAAVGQDQHGRAAGQEDVGALADLLARQLEGLQATAGTFAPGHPAVLDLVGDTGRARVHPRHLRRAVRPDGDVGVRAGAEREVCVGGGGGRGCGGSASGAAASVPSETAATAEVRRRRHELVLARPRMPVPPSSSRPAQRRVGHGAPPTTAAARIWIASLCPCHARAGDVSSARVDAQPSSPGSSRRTSAGARNRCQDGPTATRPGENPLSAAHLTRGWRAPPRATQGWEAGWPVPPGPPPSAALTATSAEPRARNSLPSRRPGRSGASPARTVAASTPCRWARASASRTASPSSRRCLLDHRARPGQLEHVGGPPVVTATDAEDRGGDDAEVGRPARARPRTSPARTPGRRPPAAPRRRPRVGQDDHPALRPVRRVLGHAAGPRLDVGRRRRPRPRPVDVRLEVEPCGQRHPLEEPRARSVRG